MTPSASFQEDLAVAKNLAETDPHNADWQRSLSDSFNFVGEVLVAQGKLGEALQYFHEGLAVSDRLAKAHPAIRKRKLLWRPAMPILVWY
jgi:hypothetical protein